uniref:DUF8039 domain-containing protein n=1 Tax=Daucus carota subsp. sativus TaxID=79200 RepID=A0A166AHC5_DAUCS
MGLNVVITCCFNMFKFLTACPYHFDMSKDYPGFMNEDWFDLDEFQNFYEDLTSVKEKEFSLSDTTIDKNKDGEGNSIQMIKNVNHDMLQTPPSHDLFKSNDALPALVCCDGCDVWVHAECADFSGKHSGKKSSPLPAFEESKIEGDGVKKKKTIKFKFKQGEQRKSPRLIEAKKNPNDYAKHDTKVAAEEGERNSTEDISFEPVVIVVVDKNEDERNLDSNNEDKDDEDDFIEDVGTIDNKVAFGVVIPSEDGLCNKIHGRDMPIGCLRVSVDGLLPDSNKDALLPVPVPGEMELVTEYVGSHVAWPENLITFPSVVFFYLDRSVNTEYRAEWTRPVVMGWRDSLIENRNRSESIDGTFMKGEIDVNQDDEEAAILKLRKTKESYELKILWIYFKKEMMSQVDKDIKEFEFVYKKCKNNLKMANDLFPNHPSLKLYEDTFAKIYQPPNQEEEEEHQRLEPENDRDTEWPYYTNKDWKTIDILALPKFDRAYNKMINIDDFLGDLTLGGERIDFDRFAREEDNEYIPGRLRREVKVGDSQKSPYLDRTIDFNRQKITKAEEEVWNWITGDTSDPTLTDVSHIDIIPTT